MRVLVASVCRVLVPTGWVLIAPSGVLVPTIGVLVPTGRILIAPSRVLTSSTGRCTGLLRGVALSAFRVGKVCRWFVVISWWLVKVRIEIDVYRDSSLLIYHSVCGVHIHCNWDVCRSACRLFYYLTIGKTEQCSDYDSCSLHGDTDEIGSDRY
jgi:hypothetical protein